MVVEKTALDRCLLLGIPLEMLHLIISKLDHPRDLIMLSLTNKFFQANRRNMLLVLDPKICSSKVPHLIMFHINQLYQPVYHYTYQLLAAADFSKPDDYQLKYSKHGWFLMTRFWPDCVYFYNPVTKVSIELPDPPSDVKFCVYNFIFPPTSRQCKVVGVAHDIYNEVTIGVIERRDTWKLYSKDVTAIRDGCCLTTRFYLKRSTDPIWFRGVLCCLGTNGDVMTFDPYVKFGSPIRFIKCRSDIQDDFLTSPHHSYLVQSEGDLLVVFVEHNGGWARVYRINLKHKLFEDIRTLRNKVLYVSPHGCFSQKCSMKELENRIYIPKFHEGHGLFYSLETQMFHTTAGYSTNNFRGAKLYSESMWIRPKFDNTCQIEFIW